MHEAMAPAPGGELHVQVWYRDAGGHGNLSNSLTLSGNGVAAWFAPQAVHQRTGLISAQGLQVFGGRLPATSAPGSLSAPLTTLTAGSISHTVEVPGDHTWGGAQLTLPPFDPALGQLSYVKITPSLEVLWAMVLENNHTVPDQFCRGWASWIPGPWDPLDPYWPAPAPGLYGTEGNSFWRITAVLALAGGNGTSVEQRALIKSVPGSQGTEWIPSPNDGVLDFGGYSGGTLHDYRPKKSVEGIAITDPIVLQALQAGASPVLDLSYSAEGWFTTTGGSYTTGGVGTWSRAWMTVEFGYL